MKRQLLIIVLCCSTFRVVFVSCEKQIERRALADYSEFAINPDYGAVSRKEALPYPLTAEPPVPIKVEVPTHQPFIVYVPSPYPVYLEKKIPYPVNLPTSQLYDLEKRIPFPVKVPFDNINPIDIDKTYPVLLETKFPYKVQKYVPYQVSAPGESTYQAKVTVLKSIPFIVEKSAPFPVNQPVINPTSATLEKPIAISIANPPLLLHPIQKSALYPAENPVQQQFQVKYPKNAQKPTGNEGLFFHVQDLQKFAQVNKLIETVENESNKKEYVSPIKLNKTKAEQQSAKDETKETNRESRSNENTEELFQLKL